MDTVTGLLRAAELIAQAKRPDLTEEWVRLSHELGSLVPFGSAVELVQEVGRLDLLLRAMEDESDALLHPLGPMSTTWIALAYEVGRALRQRKVNVAGLSELLDRLELVRMPLLKFEIAKDRTLDAPVELYRHPSVGVPEPSQRYDPKDPLRAIRPLAALGPEGLVWGVMQSPAAKGVWIRRRDLSNEFLQLRRSAL